GNPTLLSRYIDFYYNFPTKDFIYHLNDLLIFSEAPTDKIIKRGIREKVAQLAIMEKKIEKLIKERFLFEKNMFTINISNRKGLREANKLLNYLGLFMEKRDKGTFKIDPDDSEGIVDYHRFANIRTNDIEKLINKTNRLFYNHVNSNINIPFDFKFLREVTDLTINSENFFELMVTNKKFSIFLGILYRLSDLEIKYISEISENKEENPWKLIYSDKKFLLGLFNLSSALKVNNKKLLLPGGPSAEKFWSVLTGAEYSTSKFKFLKNLATIDEGKLNYLFTFSFFLPENKIKPLFFNFDTIKMKKIYDLINLGKNEKLSEKKLSRLREPGFFTLLFALKVKNGKVLFPCDIRSWIKVFNNKTYLRQMKNETSEDELYYLFLCSLLSTEKKESTTPIKIFVSIYSKFFDRPELLQGDMIEVFYNSFDKYNILIDYIEKIDIRSQETVLKLFNWVPTLDTLGKNDKALFSAIFQSFFEIFSFKTKYDPNGFDFDRLVTDLINIPMNKRSFLKDLFVYLEKNINIPKRPDYINKRFSEFLLGGIRNRIIDMDGSEYEFLLKNLTRDSINEIISSQEVMPLSDAYQFEYLFSNILKLNKGGRANIYKKIVKLFQRIPHPEISSEAPKFIRLRVMSYKRSDLNRDLKELNDLIEKERPESDFLTLTEKFRQKYIYSHIKNYFVTIAYALNAKTEKMRIFINPNLVRLHDFEDSEKNTPWNYSGRPESGLTAKTIPGFRLKGGLSRLNLIFSTVWIDQMLAGNIIYDKNLVQSLFSNLFNQYPFSNIKYFPEYAALLIDYSVEMIRKAQNDKDINKELTDHAGKVLSGFTYKKLIDYLQGNAKQILLFYDNYFKIGKKLLNCTGCLDKFSAKNELTKFKTLPLKAEINNEKNRFGNIYYSNLGTLRSYWRQFYPMEVGNLLHSGSYNGEIFREFKLKIAHISNKKRYSPLLYGHFLFNYLISTFPRFYQQNYEKDYYTSYFIFNILNNANLKKIIKRYQKKGYMRLR
ncbi:MAG: hypothetical protein ABFR75_13445, partial [Acidobacteriota bacterium]